MSTENQAVMDKGAELTLGLLLEHCTVTSDLSVGCIITVILNSKPVVYDLKSKQSIKSVYGRFVKLEVLMHSENAADDDDGAVTGPGVGTYVWPKDFTAQPSSVVTIAGSEGQIQITFRNFEGNDEMVTLIKQGTA